MTAATAQLRFWCDMSTECVRRDHTPSLSAGDQRGPFLTARALGMALAALHDAHAIANGRPPLLGLPPLPNLSAVGASNAVVAAAAACAQVLRLRYPNQSHLLAPAWLHWLDYFGLGAANSPAEVAGRAYGTMVHQFGASDAANAAATTTSCITCSWKIDTPSVRSSTPRTASEG